MKRFEAEARALKPDGFDSWYGELRLLANSEGLWAAVGMLWFSPAECCAYLQTIPGAWALLETEARYTDRERYREGVHVGRRVGV
jgi:hypothetical protein